MKTDPHQLRLPGLEVDKFNREYVKNYVDGYLKMYADTVGAEQDGQGRNLVHAHGQH